MQSASLKQEAPGLDPGVRSPTTRRDQISMAEPTGVHLTYRNPNSHSALLKSYYSDILSAETAGRQRVRIEH